MGVILNVGLRDAEPTPHIDLPISMFGREPFKGHTYDEAELKNGSRGRVVGDCDDKVTVELYATGDREELLREDVKLTKRNSR